MSPGRRKGDAPERHEMEIELKYAVADPVAVRDLVDVETIAGLLAGPWRTMQLVDRYFDTQSKSLERAGYGARLRRSDHHTLLTVKSAQRESGAQGQLLLGPSDAPVALHERLEMEAPANDQLDPRRWPESPARSLVEATVGRERLRTLFIVDQRREERELSRRDGSVVAKLSLDAGDVRRFGRRLGSFSTLEVESVDLDASEAARTLEQIASQLEASGLVEPERRSKEEIGMALVAGATPHGRRRQEATSPPDGATSRPAEAPSRPDEAPSRAEVRAQQPQAPRQPGVRSDDTLAEAGRKVLRMHLLRMLEAEAGARAGEDIEAVHRMRVATRRMRAAWRVFDGAYKRRPQRRYVGELRDVASALGAVRDLDVQLERLARYGQSVLAGSSGALTPLVDEWQRRRDVARSHLLDLLASADYDHFVEDYRDFVDTAGVGARKGTPIRLRDTVGARVWRAYERLRAHEPALPWADVAELHALRIDGKRLRYTLEFFREVLPAGVDRLISEITALQDHLGMLNDAQIAADLTRQWLVASAASISDETRQAAGDYLEASESEVARLRRKFRPVWRRVATGPLRRRLAIALSAL